MRSGLSEAVPSDADATTSPVPPGGDVVVDRLRHAAAADLVIALYNPRSKHRPHQLGEAQKVLLETRSADTVVVVGRDRAVGALDPNS